MIKDNVLVDRALIQEYAKRNTSPKMPIEQKVLQAYTDAILNSKDVVEIYKILDDITCNGTNFNYFLSYWKENGRINDLICRAVVSYSMNKKDERLFWMLEWALFTGYLRTFRSPFLEEDVTSETDEIPLRNTDEELFTDMEESIGDKGLYVGMHCIFCDDPLEDGRGSEYQSLDKLWNQLQKGKLLITASKPARINMFLFYQRYCLITGSDSKSETCGVDLTKPFSSPFGWGIDMRYTDEDWWETHPDYELDGWKPPEGGELRYTDDETRGYTDLSGIINNLSTKTKVELKDLYPEAHIENEEVLEAYIWGLRKYRWVRFDPGMLRIIFVFRIWKDQVRDKPDFAKDKKSFQDNVWGQITIPSGTADVPDVVFTPKAQPLQATSDFYFLQLEIRIPYDGEATWEDDNEWRDWWDWQNMEKTFNEAAWESWYQTWDYR